MVMLVMMILQLRAGRSFLLVANHEGDPFLPLVVRRGTGERRAPRIGCVRKLVRQVVE